MKLESIVLILEKQINRTSCGFITIFNRGDVTVYA